MKKHLKLALIVFIIVLVVSSASFAIWYNSELEKINKLERANEFKQLQEKIKEERDAAYQSPGFC